MCSRLDSLFLTFLILFTAGASCGPALHQGESMHHIILDAIEAKGNTKQLFKAWHFVFDKNSSYELNTEEGINKYKIFRENVRLIKEHNAKNLSWKNGLNEYSDMTEEEMKAYLGVRDKTTEEVNEIIGQITGKKLDFDAYADIIDKEDKEDPVPPQDPSATRSNFDWENTLPPIKNQGQCGSCYAFSTQAAIEANWFIKEKLKNPEVTPISLSPQQIVDCCTKTSGCNGGWMYNAIAYLKTSGIALDSKYPYTGRKGNCSMSKSKLSNVKVTGFITAGSLEKPGKDDVYNLLRKGPLGSCIDTAGIYKYRSGVSKLKCSKKCPHAVNVIGYGVDATSKLNYIRFRNSWGTSWGEKGYGRVHVNYANGFTCMLEFPGWSFYPTLS